MYAELHLNKDIQNLYIILKAENLNYDRAKVSYEKNKKRLKISIEAKDVVALKTILSTLLKIIETYYKAK